MNSPESITPTIGNVSLTSTAQPDLMVVGLGASAGGINALKEFFAALPAETGMAFIVILHLSQEHESYLAQILQSTTQMVVTQVQATLTLEPNHVYVIPPNRHLKLVDGVVTLVKPQRTRGRRVPIDLLFRTLGEAHGKNAVCIVLSGTGSDGTLGLKRVKEAGGITLVQDPLEAEYDGMPRHAIATNLVDLVLPVAQMPAKLLALQARARHAELLDSGADKPPPAVGTDALREVLTLLKIRTGHDFSSYKRPTLLRRVARRLQVHELADLPVYFNFLRENPDEIQALLRDLLISVTNFFRDPETFVALEREVIPRLFHGKKAGDQVRVWVAACATGEEAYSLAMLMSEYAEKLSDPPTIQIFASDIDENAIRTARLGRYDETLVADVAPARLKQFFVKDETHYQVKKSLREMLLFASHNLLHDPPFSQLDFISCRNLLIYLNRETQAQVFNLFHFALRQDGFLLLGNSESAEIAAKLFLAVEKKARIYQSRPTALGYRPVPALPVAGRWQVNLEPAPLVKPEGEVSASRLHQWWLEKYAPPSALVNQDYEIVHLSGPVARYLRFSSGVPSYNLLKLVQPELSLELRAALLEAKQDNRATQSREVAAQLEGEAVLVNLLVRPCELPGTAEGFLLVIFEELALGCAIGAAVSATSTPDGATDALVGRLSEELQQTKERLRATLEQHETVSEEHRAAHEELQAINEEMRSATEELETSKEELQSVNEELTTINQELKDKMEEVGRANADLQNLMASTDIGTIFLDRALCIKRYTPFAQALFNILPADLGRPLEHLTHKLVNYAALHQDALQVLQTLLPFEREVQGENGRTYLARFLPYRTLEDKIDGVVLTFIDINERKQMEQALEAGNRRKSEFLATLAHELRNPLAPLVSGLEILQHSGDAVQLQQARGTMGRQLTQLVRLVDDLLDIGRISQGKIKLQLERVGLAEVIQVALEANRPALVAAQHELQVSLPAKPLYLKADVTRLAQVFSNLLNNAVKYTLPRGKIRLSAAVEDQQAVIRLKDSGIGIPTQMLPHIFELFIQVEQSSKQMQGGLGIGLNLVKTLVEMHGGTIAAASTGAGSEFVVRLPLAANQKTPRHTAQKAPPAPVTPRRILVVDDNADALDMMNVLLTRRGHQVLLAYNGTSAIKMALETQPEVVLLDLGLPDLDGYEVARQLREKLPQTLLIVLSGWGQTEDRRRSRAAGCDYHLVKPVEFEELEKLL
jgi:two-component system, chemotaxis family, CheB/CheR fusion protein